MGETSEFDSLNSIIMHKLGVSTRLLKLSANWRVAIAQGNPIPPLSLVLSPFAGLHTIIILPSFVTIILIQLRLWQVAL